ncbi:MAG TPA: Uma2 family endonuclease [Bacteroidia bacterium]|nr:Uma2 family endonuclease [Bacteroidia bacterium]
MSSTLLEKPAAKRDAIPPLENGDHLSASEFLRRYEVMPEVKKAELIQNIVYMASPVRTDLHGEPDGLIQTWLGTYAAHRSGIRHATNSTVRLGPDDVPQPDAVLFLAPESGGRASIDEKGYLCGSPELVVEIAASSVSRDAREKLVSYRRAGVAEYLLWRVEDGVIEWFSLESDEYRPLPDHEGVVASRAFPGLALNVRAALIGDRAAVLETLRKALMADA